MARHFTRSIGHIARALDRLTLVTFNPADARRIR
jgi:hypothetical protein